VQIPNLRELRELHGLTQKELADVSGVSLRSVAGYEGGAHVRPNTARKLAQALNVEVADLAGATSYPKEQAPPSPEQPSFNGLLEEQRRGSFLQSCRRHARARAEQYERRLGKAQEDSAFAGHEGALILFDAALEEYDQLSTLLARDLADLFIEDQSDDAAVLAFSVEAVTALRPLREALERISDRADELAETEAQKAEVEARREEIRAVA